MSPVSLTRTSRDNSGHIKDIDMYQIAHSDRRLNGRSTRGTGQLFNFLICLLRSFNFLPGGRA